MPGDTRKAHPNCSCDLRVCLCGKLMCELLTVIFLIWDLPVRPYVAYSNISDMRPTCTSVRMNIDNGSPSRVSTRKDCTVKEVHDEERVFLSQYDALCISGARFLLRDELNEWFSSQLARQQAEIRMNISMCLFLHVDHLDSTMSSCCQPS